MGEKGKNINSTLDSDTARLLAGEFGYTVEDVALNPTRSSRRRSDLRSQARARDPRARWSR
jgi:hypothetical protein